MNCSNEDAKEMAALERLLEIAGSDAGQSRRVANFLITWPNTGTCGGFDLTELWPVDVEISDDMLTIIHLVSRLNAYPDVLGYREEFTQLVRDWRPHVIRYPCRPMMIAAEFGRPFPSTRTPGPCSPDDQNPIASPSYGVQQQ